MRDQEENKVPQHHEVPEHHEEGIQWTPKKIVTTVLLGFIVPIGLIVMMLNLVIGSREAPLDPKVVERNIQPIGQLSAVDPAAPKIYRTGQEIAEASCASCHSTGAMGAPKTGEAADWSARIGKGFDTLVQNAINGINAMPPRGGNPDLDDIEVARAVAYLANSGGANFQEPAAPAAAAPAAAAPAAAAPAPAAPAPAAAPAAPAAPVAPAAPAPAAPAAINGQAVYEANCIACHGSGVLGAPKAGDKAAWSKRLADGKEALYADAIKGVGAMPPRGGNPTLSDAEVKAAVDFMIK